MATRLKAVFYRAPDGSEPVDAYIASQPVRDQVLIDNVVDRLNDLTDERPHLPFPHSSQLRGSLRELRCRVGRTQHRILYSRSDSLVVLLHAFTKAAKEVPEDEIAVALRRWEDFRSRMNETPRRPPRAAGHDAPPSRG
ncbi:MAG: type II toxin-antitoxin system RelE/ParE family toxin [Solirubrobacteraceae bacterium]